MSKLTQAEAYVCKDQLGRNGSFYTTLIKAIRIADTDNRERLARGFPELVEALQRFRNESGYFEELAARWNEENPGHKIIA